MRSPCAAINDPARPRSARRARSRSASSPWLGRCSIAWSTSKRACCSRAVRPEQRDERRLARLGVLADALARRLLVALMVEEVVGDLEGEADVAGIAAVGRPRLGAAAGAMMHAASTADSISAPVLSCCSRVIAGRSSACPRRRGPSSGRRPSRAARPRGPAPAPARSGRTDPRGSRRRRGSRRPAHGGVAGEHRGRLVECLVHRRLAAAQVVVVHARQIVVDQRVDVDASIAAPARRARSRGDLEQPRGRDREQGPKPLAAADRRIAHRLEQAVAPVVREPAR